MGLDHAPLPLLVLLALALQAPGSGSRPSPGHSVTEPVPAPEIRNHSFSSTADGCNVTLQCQVSGREEVNGSWTRGSPPQDLGDSEGYQLAPDGRTLRLSLQRNPPNSTVTCTASNSVDQKSISLDLRSVCQSSNILIAQAPTPRRQVSGTLGGSVVLSVDLSPKKRLKEIEWSFSAGTGVKIQLAEFRGEMFERSDPTDRFKQRLERFNETSLRIKALELGDSGVYEARIKIVPATVEERAFLLTVYAPVAQPRIRSQLLASTPEGCNVTLQCHGSGRGNVSVSWGKGNPAEELDPGRHQLSPDGRTLQLSLQPSSLNTTYTCTASNPVDQKIVSFDLQSICRSGDADGSFSKPGYIVLTFFLLVLSLGAAVWCWRMNNEKPADPAATPTGPAEEGPSDPQYTEISRSPPEGNDQALRHLENNTERSPQKEPLITTVYDQLQRTPENASEEVT